MSTLGILARGAEGLMKGGDVLAKGEEEKREAIMWNAKTEVTRKNNMDRLAQEHKNKQAVVSQTHRLAADTGLRTAEGGTVNKVDKSSAEAEARRRKVPIETIFDEKGWSSAAEYKAIGSRETAVKEADIDLNVFLKSSDGKSLDLSKAQLPNIKAQWRQAYVASLRGGKGSSLTANEFVTQFVDVRKEMIANEFADPKEVKKLMKQEGASGSPSAWIDKKARESVMAASTASQAGKGLTPSQQTRMNVADEENLAEAATKFEGLASADQVLAKAEQEKRGKTRALRAIIDRAAQDKLATLPQALGAPSVLQGDMAVSHAPTGLRTPADVFKSARERGKEVGPSVLQRISER